MEFPDAKYDVHWDELVGLINEITKVWPNQKKRERMLPLFNMQPEAAG
jgi:hypothetical protein